ncbi:hypothetical protein GWI33_002052 [Rhynchophorus ferrugineus]|uniref:Uncharacterized protein n=1 Tax=Rhynchophorus ferrugineus TaxID=354439 RepID=A0A834MKE5_RHYFE|nr:hypothetical protein GWI33_002052 [Rhynchophorus ferrugineus]
MNPDKNFPNFHRAAPPPRSSAVADVSETVPASESRSTGRPYLNNERRRRNLNVYRNEKHCYGNYGTNLNCSGVERWGGRELWRGGGRLGETV